MELNKIYQNANMSKIDGNLTLFTADKIYQTPKSGVTDCI